MRWLVRSVAALLLALWLPVTLHCALKPLPGFQFLQCCCSDESAPATPGDCQEPVCGTVESGLYKIEEHPRLTPRLDLAVVAWATGDASAPPPATPAPVLVPASCAPPELLPSWRFTRRAALPPRAPSSAA